MHPDMMLELMNQHAAELRAGARRYRLAREARTLTLARRRLAKASATHAAPEIPDYVDAMFGNPPHEPSGKSG